MALISEINTGSSQVITARGGLMQVLISGTWNSATIPLQKNVDGTWITVREYTEDAYEIIETVGSGQYRFGTPTGGTPSVTCDVTFDGPGSGSIA